MRKKLRRGMESAILGEEVVRIDLIEKVTLNKYLKRWVCEPCRYGGRKNNYNKLPKVGVGMEHPKTARRWIWLLESKIGRGLWELWSEKYYWKGCRLCYLLQGIWILFWMEESHWEIQSRGVIGALINIFKVALCLQYWEQW